MVKKFTICLESNWLEVRGGFTSQLTWFISELRAHPQPFYFMNESGPYRTINSRTGCIPGSPHSEEPKPKSSLVPIPWVEDSYCQNLSGLWHGDNRKDLRKEGKIQYVTTQPDTTAFLKHILLPTGRNGRVEGHDTWRRRFDIRMTKFGHKSEGVSSLPPSTRRQDSKSIPLISSTHSTRNNASDHLPRH